jgi:dihydrofolate synthase/folylpolyglutamate synthase
VAVVTGVALDHEVILGDTLAKIAAEKAGIWKPGRPAIVGASGMAEAVPVLIEAARAAGASAVVVVDDAAVAAVPPVSLPGRHQRRNAAAAIAAVQALGLPVVGAALASVVHPGRFEVIGPPGAPSAILDGAHNPHGAAALAAALAERAVPGDRPVLVIAASADKDIAGIAAALAPAVRAVVATRFQQDRAMEPAALAAVFAGLNVAARPAAELRAALAIAAAHGATIIVAGSLFLVGEARTLLLGAPTDPMLVTDPPAR